jgi:hypothetical protein
MAGSLSWRDYTTDAGVLTAIKIDESNANAVITGQSTKLCPVRTGNNPPLGRYTRKRYVLAYNQANPNERRRFYIGSTAAVTQAQAAGATITAEDYPAAGDAAGTSQTWVITSYKGEKVTRLVPAFSAPDTGLTDGTASQ